MLMSCGLRAIVSAFNSTGCACADLEARGFCVLYWIVQQDETLKQLVPVALQQSALCVSGNVLHRGRSHLLMWAPCENVRRCTLETSNQCTQKKSKHRIDTTTTTHAAWPK
jgi:hypothetical protein